MHVKVTEMKSGTSALGTRRSAEPGRANCDSVAVKNVSAATSEAMTKIDPAIKAAVEAGRSVLSGDWHACRCQCGTAHPDDKGVCDGRAVLTRRVGQADTRLCAPCAVAQGVAEMPH